MRILLTGSNGQVGWELRRTLVPLGEVLAFDRRALDLNDAGAIRTVIRETKPDLIVNAAAYTAVDRAESDTDLAMAINAVAPGVLAEEAKAQSALLVHYSTDYVFDGTKVGPYVEDDPPAPVNAYGRSKLAGERAIQAAGGRHLILRTSWVYGLRGQNFLLTMLRLAREKNELSIVADQFGAPTWSRLIAEVTALALDADPPEGIYHVTCAGRTSWHGFAEAIFETSGWKGRLTPIPGTNYPVPAARPANSLLDNGKLAATCKLALPDWREALRLCLDSRAA